MWAFGEIALTVIPKPASSLAVDAGEPDDPGLRRGVVGLADVAVQPGVRRDVDDPPVVLLTHRRDRRPRDVERAGEVHAEHGLPVVVAELPHHAVAQDAGVVDDDVEPARRPDDVGDGRVDRSWVGHVDDDRNGAGELAGSRLGHTGLVDVGDAHRRAGVGEAPADRQPDATCRRR